MGKKDQAKARRAQKKHQKDVKRRKVRAAEARAAAAPPRWHPSQGILGLAMHQKTSFEVASHEVTQMVAHGRFKPDLLWTRERVEAMGDEAILAALAGVGIDIDRAAFAELVAAHEGSFDLAMERWQPLVAGPVDLDLGIQAARVLWKRWHPGRLSIEDLDELGERCEEALERRDADAALRVWTEALEKAGEAGEAERNGALLAEELAVGLMAQGIAWSEAENARALQAVEALAAASPSPPITLLRHDLAWRAGKAEAVAAEVMGSTPETTDLLWLAWRHFEGPPLSAHTARALRDHLLTLPGEDPNSADVDAAIDDLSDWLDEENQG